MRSFTKLAVHTQINIVQICTIFICNNSPDESIQEHTQHESCTPSRHYTILNKSTLILISEAHIYLQSSRSRLSCRESHYHTCLRCISYHHDHHSHTLKLQKWNITSQPQQHPESPWVIKCFLSLFFLMVTDLECVEQVNFISTD